MSRSNSPGAVRAKAVPPAANAVPAASAKMVSAWPDPKILLSNEADMELKNKVAVVTGSAKRVGQAIALTLASRGASIVLHYRSSKKEAEATAAEIRNLGAEA